MSANNDDLPFTSEEYNGLTTALPYLLAGLEGHIEEFQLFGITLQRTNSGDFRCVLRSARKGPGSDAVRLVAFTNADLAVECLLHLEFGFRESSIRWTVDQYANGNLQNGVASPKLKQLTLIK